MSGSSSGRSRGWGNIDPDNLPDVMVATYTDLASMPPELLAQFDITISLDGIFIPTADANMASERGPQATRPSTPGGQANVSSHNDSVTEVISPEAEQLSAERPELAYEAAQQENKVFQRHTQRTVAEEKARKSREEQEARLEKEIVENRERKQEASARKAEQEVFKRAERAEQARKTKEARKAAAERRKNFGAA